MLEDIDETTDAEAHEAEISGAITQRPEGETCVGHEGKSSKARNRGRLLVADWLIARGMKFSVKGKPDSNGRTVYALEACPFNPTHAEARITQEPGGKLAATCPHESCRRLGWKAFRSTIGEPQMVHYESAPQGDGVPEPSLEKRPTVEPDPKPVILIDKYEVCLARSLDMITDRLKETGAYFVRAGKLVRIDHSGIFTVLKAEELQGQVSAFAAVRVMTGKHLADVPLPKEYAKTWLHNPLQASRLSQITHFTRNPVYTSDWRISPPGFDASTGIYYAGPRMRARAGTERLGKLLKDFCFKNEASRTNYVAMLMTAILMPRFIGSHPAALLIGNQPGIGKTILAQILAILRDGQGCVMTASYNPNDEEFEKRLGAIVRSGQTTLLIDNAKGGPRSACIDSPCLERTITDHIVSFRLLKESANISVENSLIVCITANTLNISDDLIKRSMTVSLEWTEGNPKKRTFSMADPEAYAADHREELIGELLGMVELWRSKNEPRSKARSRFDKKGWAPMVGGILEASGFANLGGNGEDAAQEMNPATREFGKLVAVLAGRAEKTWTSTELVKLADRHNILSAQLNGSTLAERATSFGMLASKYVGDWFGMPDGSDARMMRDSTTRPTRYSLERGGDASGLNP